MASVINIIRCRNCATLLNGLKFNIQCSLTTINLNQSHYSSTSSEPPQALDNEELEIDKIRNVSRMPAHLRKALHGETLTFNDSTPNQNWWVRPLQEKKIKRKYFGRYGKESGVNPGILWPSEQEILAIKAREKEFFPSLQEMVSNVQKEKKEESKQKRLRVAEVQANLKKLDGWLKDLETRKQKKIDETNAQRLKREKLLEEVRAHFGYIVDPEAEQFKELLAQKEKEEKKARKEAKKKEFIAKELAKMQEIIESRKKEKENLTDSGNVVENKKENINNK